MTPKVLDYLRPVPDQVDGITFWTRAALWVGFAFWGFALIRLDVRTGEIAESFIHRPLLVFHEAGHVVFMPFGEWLTVFGGSFFQVLMPAILGIALLVKNRDAFGASLGLWFVGISVVDVAAYIYDAWGAQLTLLGGRTGNDGPHDWIYLLRTVGMRRHAHLLGVLVHHAGAGVVLLALAWGAWVLKAQYAALRES